MSGSDVILDAEQDRMMEEQCILVDQNDKPIGHISKRICHKNTNIKSGMLHRAFSVFLFNSRGELLLQQRASSKVTFPLHWTNTCCSHPLHTTSDDGTTTTTTAGTEQEEHAALGVKRAAVRKLEHELGIQPGADVSIEQLHWLTKIYYCASSDGEWGEHEIDWILFTQTDLPSLTSTASSLPAFNANECEAIRWVSADQLRGMISDWRAGKLLLTPWFALIAEKLLFGWWEKLTDVIANDGIGEEQRGVIHRLAF